MKLLDIIVTHYKESWATGKKFFDMLALQRCVNFDDIRVILVNDGADGALDESIFSEYPFKVDVLTIPHGGISAARNAGIDATQARWLTFCDFDDLYASVYSLRQVFMVLDTNAFDILYADFISEDRMKSGETLLHKRGENTVFIHAKFWRREWLIDSGIRFNTGLQFNEDSAFCTVAFNTADYKRTGHIDSSIPVYIWCYTENSATTTQSNRIKCLIGLYERNKIVCEHYKTLDYKRYCAMVSRTIHDAYWCFNLKELPEEAKPYLDDFKRFWKEHKRQYLDTDPQLMREVAEAARIEHETGDNEEEARFLHSKSLETNTDISLSQWLFSFEQ